MVAEVFHTLKAVLKKAGHNTNVGDEGGFAPNLDNEDAIKFILEAVDKAGYQAGPRQGHRHRARHGLLRAVRGGRQEGLPLLEVGPGQDLQQPADDRAVRLLARQVPDDRLDRGPARPGRLVRLRGPDQGAGRTRSRSSATTSTSPTPSGWPRGSPGAAPTAS